MPLRAYIFSVGGMLLALLFAADAVLPKPSVTGIAPAAERPRIRIHSERKGPEAIVFDTTRPTIVSPTAAKPEPPIAATSVAPLEPSVRKSFAQAALDRSAKIAEPRKVSTRNPRKRELAAARARRPLRLTEESHRFGFFKMTW